MLPEQRKYFKTCYQNKENILRHITRTKKNQDMLPEQRKYFKMCYQNKENI